MNWLNFVGDKNNVDPDWRVEQLNDFKKLGKIERSKIIFEIEKIILTAQVN
jgi:hypothetical protein